MNQPNPTSCIRPVKWLGVAGLTLLITLAVSPPVFNLVTRLGRSADAFAYLRDAEFEKVISRMALIVFALVLFVIARRAGIRSWSDVGLPPRRDKLRLIGYGWLAGFLSMAALFALGFMVGAYTPDATAGAGLIIRRALSYGLGGFAVGYIEEILFRGMLYRSLRSALSFGGAVLLSSALFACIHFIRPDAPIGVVHGHAFSGWALLPSIFVPGGMLDDYLPFALTLFFMGIALCAIYEWTGHLYVVIGLHAGWVLLLRTGKYLLDRNTDVAPLLYGSNDNIAKSLAALLLAMLFAAVSVWLARRRRSPGWPP